MALYQLIKGFRTGVVNLPIQLLVIEEFRRDRDATSYWGVMLLNLVLMIVAAASAAYVGFFGL